jgi:hypothetical protein
MTEQHPITPPPELVQQWEEDWNHNEANIELEPYIATRAAEWGYDQRGEVNEAELQEARDEELEACCEWLDRIAYRQSLHIRGSHLRAARRPKPPSLKEQALMALEDGDTGPGVSLTLTEVSIIRRALEALPDDL